MELVQDLIAEGLGIVEDDDGDDAAFVDERHECALDVADDLGAPGGWSRRRSARAAGKALQADQRVARVTQLPKCEPAK